MNHNTSTTNDAVLTQANTALIAILNHAIEHDLPAAHTVTLPSAYGDQHITLYLATADDAAGAWTDTVIIDVEHVDHMGKPHDWERVMLECRLPATGVRFRLRYLRRAMQDTTSLRVVTA